MAKPQIKNGSSNGSSTSILSIPQQIKNVIKQYIVGYDDEIDAILTALIMKTNCVLIGKYGTAKTLLIDLLTRTIECKVFKYLLHPFVEKEELFGYLDVKTYRETGRRVFVTEGYLPEANIVFLDEIFKAPPSVRHMLLDLLQYRRVNIDGKIVYVPLYAVYGASNEKPTETEDLPFWDRMVIRIFVKEVDETKLDELYDKALTISIEKPHINLKPICKISIFDELEKIYMNRLRKIKDDTYFRSKWKEVIVKLKNYNINLSPRRCVKLIEFACAYSVVTGDESTDTFHLAKALQFIAIDNEDQLPIIQKVIEETNLLAGADIIEKLDTLITEGKNIIQLIKEKIEQESFSIKDKKLVDQYTTKVDNFFEQLEKVRIRGNREEIKKKVTELKEIVQTIKTLIEKAFK